VSFGLYSASMLAVCGIDVPKRVQYLNPIRCLCVGSKLAPVSFHVSTPSRLLDYCVTAGSWSSLINIVYRLRQNHSAFVIRFLSEKDKFFFTLPSSPVPDTHYFLFSWYPDLFPGLKRLGREADHLTPSLLPVRLHSCHRDKLFLSSTK
jgi:hypothetical protein